LDGFYHRLRPWDWAVAALLAAMAVLASPSGGADAPRAAIDAAR